MRPARFLAVRAANTLAVLLLVALLTFFLLGRAPGDYLSDLAANPQISPATLEQLRQLYGLDQPFYISFWNWATTLLRGDAGYSFVYQRPIRDLLGERVVNTLLLNTLALLLAWGTGVALGAGAAWACEMQRRPWLDWPAGALATLLAATPTVVLAVALLAVAASWGLPVGGLPLGSEQRGLARIAELARHALLPALAVTTVILPDILRHTRTSVGATLHSAYVQTARAKGAGPARILWVHALRNACNPLATLFGFSVSSLLSASLLVEVIMNWPGIGQLAFDAVVRRDIFLVVDLAVLSAFLLMAGNLIGDLLRYAADPRIAHP
jgi:peptide/nickel transport system permease protein